MNRRFGWIVFVGAALLAAGCGSSSGPPVPAAPQYPAGWELWTVESAFRVPLGGMMPHDKALTEWYNRGFSHFPRSFTAGAWTGMASSFKEANRQYSVTMIRLPERDVPASLIEDTFAMILRRSPDMKEIEAAGAGWGQGKAYEGEGARLFVRAGSGRQWLYILSVRGEATLAADDPKLRAFFDGFVPLQ